MRRCKMLVWICFGHPTSCQVFQSLFSQWQLSVGAILPPHVPGNVGLAPLMYPKERLWNLKCWHFFALLFHLCFHSVEAFLRSVHTENMPVQDSCMISPFTSSQVKSFPAFFGIFLPSFSSPAHAQVAQYFLLLLYPCLGWLTDVHKCTSSSHKNSHTITQPNEYLVGFLAMNIIITSATIISHFT